MLFITNLNDFTSFAVQPSGHPLSYKNGSK